MKFKYWIIILSIFLLAIAWRMYYHPPAFLLKYGYGRSIKKLANAEKEQFYGLPGKYINWPKGNVVRGIDVSKYQTHVNWQTVKNFRIKFAFIKATEGFYQQDELFEAHWEESGKAGLLRGAYHFYRPNQPAALQAINFISVIDLEGGDLPPVLDVETIGNKSPEKLREGVKNWLHFVERVYGVKPIIYTNYSFYRDYLANYFPDHLFWIAHYHVPKLLLNPAENTRIKFWQHTDEGAIPGIKGRTDCNIFYGSYTDLQALLLK
ncbi:glycoside hydrolase family 25 protein [Adhaeribacter aquaticus]|uniref:glycoside hydrolase family 25 protein n=1 Tax=Adhaeribacter aquaticus TaxID=299567 RepID=UPI0003F78DF3|nr:GH25 family lysozyme [Adhaeribacter aquaticus]